jgi:hypothetical protein
LFYNLIAARRPLILGALLGTTLLAGCGGPARGADQSTIEEIVQTAIEATVQPGTEGAGGGPDHSLAEAERAGAPSVIYYDLTHFDWYRRGEPIQIGGQSFRPREVQPTGERKFHQEGSYDGVDYYISRDESEPYDTIYVPVYNGYWLPFALDGAAPEPAN